MVSRTRTIGILGGMGPAATVEFMQRIVMLTDAEDDHDHFRMLVDNNPKVPSRIAALIEKTGPSPLPVLIEMAQGLERAGADFLVMPCNTAHHYHRQLQDAVGIPFISIVDVAAEYIQRFHQSAKRIGFLASPAVRTVGVYDKRFSESDLTIVYPDDHSNAALLGLIREIKAGLAGDVQAEALQNAATRLAQSSDLILVACTELSILPAPRDVIMIDTLDLLVGATISAARGK